MKKLILSRPHGPMKCGFTATVRVMPKKKCETIDFRKPPQAKLKRQFRLIINCAALMNCQKCLPASAFGRQKQKFLYSNIKLNNMKKQKIN
ncbi:MAG: hypothetical protein IJ808_05470 [Muribaculaceae bacterium]|nr:hypothetical protein [Muribaculaceae bacterium]